MSASAAVIFDLGKVLLDFDYALVIRRLVEAGADSEAFVRQTLLESSLLSDYESGQLDSRTFHERLTGALGLQLDYARFRWAFADIFTPIPAMIEANAAVRAGGFPTFILSNTNEIAIAHIRHRFPFFRGFDGYVCSHEVGAMKPSEAIYRALENLTGIAPANLFYLDDRPENVEVALVRGWRGHVHVHPESSLTALRNAGFIR